LKITQTCLDRRRRKIQLNSPAKEKTSSEGIIGVSKTCFKKEKSEDSILGKSKTTIPDFDSFVVKDETDELLQTVFCPLKESEDIEEEVNYEAEALLLSEANGTTIEYLEGITLYEQLQQGDKFKQLQLQLSKVSETHGESDNTDDIPLQSMSDFLNE